MYSTFYSVWVPNDGIAHTRKGPSRHDICLAAFKI